MEITQVPMIDAPQSYAREWLAQLVGGNDNGLNLGAAYPGSLGNFNLSDIERSSLGNLASFVSGNPTDFNTARGVLNKYATSEFAPDLNAFQKSIARETNTANDVLNREAAITGSRFSTGIQNAKSNLAAMQSEALQNELARQYEKQTQNRLTAAMALPGLATSEQNSALQRLSAGLSMGGAERDLQNKEAQAQLNEFNRQRNEQLSRIQVGQNLASSNVPYGIMSMGYDETSPFQKMANSVLGSIGSGVASGSGGGLWNTIGDVAGGMFGIPNGGSLLSGLVKQVGTIGSGNQAGTGIFGTRLGGSTQSQILGFNTAQYR